MNLLSSLFVGGLVIRSNMRYDGFSSLKSKLSVFALVLVSTVSCLGFYGDNYIIEFCYSLFPLIALVENSYVGIIQYNFAVNSVYIPVKNLMALLNIAFNDGWMADESYWPFLVAYLAP